jgi:putative oxidoreductase
MLNAITPAQVEELIFLLEQLSEARKARAAEGKKQTPDEIVDDPRRRHLTDYLYALSDEARKELIALMLLGRGDFDHFYQRAIETCSRYTTADDQVLYLMGKTVRLAEYLSNGLQRLAALFAEQMETSRKEVAAMPATGTTAPALVAIPPADMAVAAAAAWAVPVPAAAARTASRFSAARTVYRMVVTISALLPYSVIAIVLRFVMAQIVFLSGQRKIVGPVYRLDLQGFDLSVTLPTGVKESVYLMFDKMANLPLPSWLAAPVVSYAEFIFPICLMLGFATRFAAIGLLIITAVIQVVVLPEALWSLHIYWASILLVLISLGPGVVSIDHVIRRFYEK